MSDRLQGRRVLVIGRSSGIARAITRATVAAGATVIAAGRDGDKLAAAYRDPNVTVEQVDVTDEASIAALASRLGRVDHIVSTASARARGTLAALTHDVVLTSFEVKVVGPILIAKHFAPRVPPDGSLVLFSGSSARKPAVGMLAVGATNAAVDAVTRNLAVELAPIRVNAISPGTVDTGAYDTLGEKTKTALFATRENTNPARRIGTSDDIAETVLFALTSTFMTGVSLAIDGGEPLV